VNEKITLLWKGYSMGRGAKDAKFGEIGKDFSLRSWRPFGGVYPDKGRAQDRLGAINFVEVVLSNI